jgi:hypothetical protein
MPFAIKAHVVDAAARVFDFSAAKTMYGGNHIRVGDRAFLFASENEGGCGLVAWGVVTRASPIPRMRGLARQTPRVSVTFEATSVAKRSLGRSVLKPFADWDDGRPETELNFKLYRQATNKIVGISTDAAVFLATFF